MRRYSAAISAARSVQRHMSKSTTPSARWAHLLNRLAARRATLSAPITALISQPEPRSIGYLARGRQLCAGNFVFAGHLVQAPDTSIWAIVPPDPAFAAETHGFGWLDDLAAVGDAAARARAQDWLADWIRRYGRGSGPGWTPDLTGRRLIRWISHALFLLRGQASGASAPLFRSLAQQTAFLAGRWRATSPGLARFEALTGLIYASLSLEGMQRYLAPARAALARECEARIDATGGLPTRNPEELLEVFTLLTWTALTLSEAGHTADDVHWRAIERIAPTLRNLRHADGGLARFHGGGRGLEGRLDAALAASGVRTRNAQGLAMGFVRLAAGRSSVIIDAAAPPTGAASANAHASTLAFELTSGRRPLIVNCGSGGSFGAEWRRAGRATPSHSTLVLASQSSARLSNDPSHPDWLIEAPRTVQTTQSRATDGYRLETAQDGYVRAYGLTHVRQFDLTFDGRGLAGEDMLIAVEEADKRRFDHALDATRLHGVPFDIRFHLHPDIDASLDMGGTAISLALRSGEIWVFRSDGRAALSLQPSVYLEKTRLKPRAAEQIVLSGRATAYATHVRWSLAKAKDTPVGLRDLTEDRDPPAPDD